jgi:phosphomannomutase
MTKNTKNSIKFGTDGWRAIIAKDFTVENLGRVTQATSKWLLKKSKMPSVVIGYDCRFGGKFFAEVAAKVFCANGIRVFLSEDFASTPMVSLGTVKLQANLGVVITASHNPSAYNGFKLKGPYGGPLLPERIEEVEKLIPAKCAVNTDELDLQKFVKEDLLTYVDLETMYCEHAESAFDLAAIRNSNLRIAYDGMFGAGQNVLKRLLPDAVTLHCDFNPSFNGRAPEPIHRNLGELSGLIKNTGNIDLGFATDGDADRIGLYDNEGNFVDSHHIILLLINYLKKEKQMNGKVVTAFSVSPKIGKLCDHYKIDQQVTKIGFKHIAGIMVTEDVLIGGEESGGIAVKGHIPERDGIWIALLLMECMAGSGKSLQQLIADVYEVVGTFTFERSDLHLQEELKNRIVQNCENDAYQSFGNYKIQRIEKTDGYKYFFNDNEWLMIRASGTEPVLRNYAESDSLQSTLSILKAAEQTLLNTHV